MNMGSYPLLTHPFSTMLTRKKISRVLSLSILNCDQIPCGWNDPWTHNLVYILSRATSHGAPWLQTLLMTRFKAMSTAGLLARIRRVSRLPPWNDPWTHNLVYIVAVHCGVPGPSCLYWRPSPLARNNTYFIDDKIQLKQCLPLAFSLEYEKSRDITTVATCNTFRDFRAPFAPR